MWWLMAGWVLAAPPTFGQTQDAKLESESPGSDLLAVRYQPTPGELHPDFILPRIDNGQPVRLSDLRGKKVLLVHFASW